MRSSSRPTSRGSRKPRSATTAGSARSSTSSTSRRRRRARCSGIPKGWTLFQSLIGYMRAEAERRRLPGGRAHPRSWTRACGRASGHLEKFGENMYTTRTPDERVYAIKPMNCPGHVQIFKHGLRSYRDLPVRLAEFGKVHRYEPSGALHGLMRVRAFTQDDAHIFITEDQIIEESVHSIELLMSIYRDFGFDDVRGQVRRPADEAGRLGRGLGPGGGGAARPRPGRPGSITPTTRARAPSTAPSSSSCCGTPSAGTGSAGRCRSTSTCRGAWAPITSMRRARSAPRSCSTGRSSAPWSALPAS